VPAGDQLPHDALAEKSGGPGDEDSHGAAV
jgi:hypothetical protein